MTAASHDRVLMLKLPIDVFRHNEFIEFRNAAEDYLSAIQDKNIHSNLSRPAKTVMVHKRSKLNGRMIRPIFIHREGLNETENLTLNSILRIHMEGFFKFFHNDKNG